MFDHIKAWNMWRKKNTNSKLYQIGVLLRLCYSPTFYFFKNYHYPVIKMTECFIEEDQK